MTRQPETEGPVVPATLSVTLPDWVGPAVAAWGPCRSDDEKMRRVIELSQANVQHRTGGPFAAAVFEAGSHRLVAVGVNSVTRLNNSVLHAEIVAFMLAQARVGAFSLRAPGLPAHELFTSCEPCAMCLGAILWSGVQRIVSAASRHDAGALNFDEGPVFPESFAYLADRGVAIVRDVLRGEARTVLELYRAGGGEIYNG
ncbi:nucleoside deaminase [bacterium]|nr:nucleoside deaminase [bacterium]